MKSSAKPSVSAEPDRNRSSALAKGLAVLAAFDGAAAEMTLAQIARATGQDRATARRGALTLVAAGYLTQGAGDGRGFRLAPKVLELAGGFLRAHAFGVAVQPVLNRHAEALGRDITLAVREGLHVLLLAQSTTAQGPVSQGFTPGSRLPLLHTSLGRMLLASESPETAATVLARAPLIRHTERAQMDRGRIGARIDRARSAGQIVTTGEFEPGIAGLAVSAHAKGRRPAALGTSLAAPADTAPPLAALHLCAAELRQTRALFEL